MAEIIPLKCEVCGCSPCETPGFCRYSKDLDANAPAGVRILSSADFIKEYCPPDYLVDGLLQRQFFYSMTGKTGGGKTAIALFIAAMVALGKRWTVANTPRAECCI